mmetsp:Transcript_4821/g.18033  ORF Transcript_4821/g.18033 Transcript_4821/m.18033 type:complete len:125 (-) Transcript_4821:114-488(-)|eukprot:CAMPEP_0117443170 /NCGR_PEP_ID=MMETSP0759-20121206/4553_1 /TAXON_ID=63605 /ORGANISM="Percolomonas cosmopolitus, Strain WS" /LENGTH=124 /DNA_ID=CAMNT_0005235129 /DNA_START=91 /DNA_END=465 /DNA_ORIENTATION=-
MSNIQNLTTYDPFADDNGTHEVTTTQNLSGQPSKPATKDNKIHLKVKKRTGRKSVTTITGLSKKFNFKKILKAFKKEFCCNGSIDKDKEGNKVIILLGDHREEVSRFFIEEKIAKTEDIVMHGF